MSTTYKLSDKLKPFYRISAPYFTNNRYASFMLILLIILTVTISFVYVYFSYVQRDIMNALSDKNVGEFYNGMLKYCGVLVIAVPIAVLRK